MYECLIRNLLFICSKNLDIYNVIQAIRILYMDYVHSMNIRLLKIELDFRCDRKFTCAFRFNFVFKVI